MKTNTNIKPTLTRSEEMRLRRVLRTMSRRALVTVIVEMTRLLPEQWRDIVKGIML